jgi:maltose alpha-D-glucosyltransferase / alpha-amylase
MAEQSKNGAYPWYKNAFFYGIDVHRFQDSDGDGIGDLQGVILRLDYLESLGVDCLWMLPFYPTPYRDNGYDVSDYIQTDPRVGSLEDFELLVKEAHQRGIRVLIDVVLDHTSDEHPWFKAARRDRETAYHSYFVWAENPPEVPPEMDTIFPGEEDGVWTYDEKAGKYFHHRFYHFQPSLNAANPQVREEILKVFDFWQAFGVDGFRLDAVAHYIEDRGVPEAVLEKPYDVLHEIYQHTHRRRSEVALLGEANVALEDLAFYFGDGRELTMLFNFLMSKFLFATLAAEKKHALTDLLQGLPAPPHNGQWLNFLRNMDELTMERLPEDLMDKTFQRFAPDKSMRIFNRGIRRRTAPMLDGDRRWIEMAYSLLFSMPGIPVVVYGDEIGMGEDLRLKGRDAVRAAMQWSSREKNAGFSTAAAERLEVPINTGGLFGYETVNVEDQQRDPESLLHWMIALIRARKSLPEIGIGKFRLVETGLEEVFAHAIIDGDGRVPVFFHNLSAQQQAFIVDLPGELGEKMEKSFGAGHIQQMENRRLEVRLPEYGYLWLSFS